MEACFSNKRIKNDKTWHWSRSAVECFSRQWELFSYWLHLALTNKNPPEVTCRQSKIFSSFVDGVITFISWAQQSPAIFLRDRSNGSISFFSLKVSPLFITPLITISSYLRVVILHPHKRATCFWKGICLTTEVLHYCFTFAVSSRGKMESTSLVFAAVESQLSERQLCSQFLHGICRE